jgi:AcrR family transcriptional regulator
MSESNGTKQKLLDAAERLFAMRGVDGVTVREILAAAGQRNMAALYYHFGTKEDLIRTLVVRGARLIDERRNRMLDELETGGAAPTVRQAVEALVRPSVGLVGNGRGEATYIRFHVLLQLNHRELFLDALQGRWNSGYQRCLGHLRTALAWLPGEVLNQRLVFVEIYLNGVIATREGVLADRPDTRGFWSRSSLLENLIDTIVAVLEAPVGDDTTALLATAEAHRPAPAS